MFLDYRSIEDLNQSIISNLYKFPHDVDLVVGVPRSGMLPANLLALYLNKPFTDIDSFIEGHIYSSGERGRFISKENTHKVIIVDDSIDKGCAKEKAEKKLSSISSEYEFLFAVVYATENSKPLVDIYCEIIDYPRVFQWNLFHHKSVISRSCFDIDGVLCQNPPVDDDGPIYKNYILNATPYIIPSIEIETLVSCRLEKYRSETEMWLKNNNVRYKNLIMLDLPTKEDRIKWGKHGEFKGKIYKQSENILFVESSLAEARIICKTSGKQVFCTETMSMLYDNKENDIREYIVRNRKERVISLIKAVCKHTLCLFR